MSGAKMHACPVCGARWECAAEERCNNAHEVCIACFVATAKQARQQLAVMECRVCRAKRTCMAAADVELEDLECPSCGNQTFDAIQILTSPTKPDGDRP